MNTHAFGEHPAEADLLNYSSGSLPPDTMLQIDRHIALCSACRAALAEKTDFSGAAQLRNSLEAELRYDTHLDSWQISALTAGSLPARLRGEVEKHLASCPACSQRVEWMKEFHIEQQAAGLVYFAPKTDARREKGWNAFSMRTRLLAFSGALSLLLLVVVSASLFSTPSASPPPAAYRPRTMLPSTLPGAALEAAPKKMQKSAALPKSHHRLLAVSHKKMGVPHAAKKKPARKKSFVRKKKAFRIFFPGAHSSR